MLFLPTNIMSLDLSKLIEIYFHFLVTLSDLPHMIYLFPLPLPDFTSQDWNLFPLPCKILSHMIEICFSSYIRFYITLLKSVSSSLSNFTSNDWNLFPLPCLILTHMFYQKMDIETVTVNRDFISLSSITRVLVRNK